MRATAVVLAGLAAGVLAVAIPCRAATIVVDASHPDAADANAGTVEVPMKTITAAVRRARAGDTVEVHGGTYRNEDISFPRSGEPGRPITLRPARGAVVIVKGSVVVSGWTCREGDDPVYTHAGWKHYFGTWHVDGIEKKKKKDGSAYTLRDARSKARNQLFVDGSYVEEVPRAGDLAPNRFYMDRGAKTVHLWLASGDDPSSHLVEMSNTEGPVCTTADQSHIVIHGIHFAHCANRPQCRGMVRVDGGSDCVVSYCRVEHAAGAGFSMRAGTRQLVRHCVFNNNGQLGFNASGTTDSLMECCETSHNNYLAGKIYNSGWEAGGNKLCRTRNVVLDRHLAHHNNGSGIWFDIDNQNATITNCVSYENKHGIHYEISYTALIYNNICYRNRVLDTRYINGPTGLGIYISSSAGCRVYNNTCWGNDKGGISTCTSIRGDGAGRQVTGYANRYFNNIVADNARIHWNSKSYSIGYGGAPEEKRAAAKPSTLKNALIPFEESESDYNLFFVEKRQFFAGIKEAKNVRDWHRITGQDAHSVWAAPQFIDPEKGDFRLRRSSPGIDRGAKLTEVGSDCIGTKRPTGRACDIGAFEWTRERSAQAVLHTAGPDAR